MSWDEVAARERADWRAAAADDAALCAVTAERIRAAVAAIIREAADDGCVGEVEGLSLALWGGARVTVTVTVTT